MPKHTPRSRTRQRRYLLPISLLLIAGIGAALFACGSPRKFQASTLTAHALPATKAPQLPSLCRASKHTTLPAHLSLRESGTLTSPQLDELSGLAPSTSQPGVFWGMNDSGHSPTLFALDANGQHLGRYQLTDAENIDWEDIAAFEWRGENWLLIADVGDNFRDREFATLYFIREPTVDSRTPANPKSPPLPLGSGHRMNFIYPDGAQNVEAVAISCDDQQIYLLGKNAPHTLYSLPLDFESSTNLYTARQHGEIQPLQASEADNPLLMALAGKMLLQPTAMDFSDDGKLALVSNYRHVYVYQRKDGERWAEALKRPPITTLDHELDQAEAICFLPGSYRFLLGSEGDHGELLISNETP